jgi:hypothetical protein
LLLPTAGQNRLYLLGPLIDRLLPRETGLLTEARHDLKQLTDTGFREALPNDACLRKAVGLRHPLM